MPVEDLRSSMRKARRSLTATQRENAAIRCAHLAREMEAVRRARCIALYMAYEGELSCTPIIDWALSRGKKVLLPVVAGNRLRLAPHRLGERMFPNRWGILEPEWQPRRWVAPRFPSVAFVPLVACDSSGNRLGQGGGYYDRTFAFRRHCVHWGRPLLIGLAYDFQLVGELAAKPTDVPLDAVISERRRIEFRP